MAARSDGLLARTPPPALFVLGALCMYVGAAIAVHLFDELPATVVAWLRICGAALVMTAVVRPWRVRWTAPELRTAAAFGVATAAMNATFYLATERVHLGSTVAIEFIGPVTVAAVSARRARAWAALVVSGSGVAMLGLGLRTDGVGVGWALAAGVCWGAYVVLGARVSSQRTGADGLALALVFGAVALAPWGVADSGPAWHSGRLLALCVVVGLLSTIVPYGIDQHVLRRIDRGSFALMLALLPVTATVVGRVVLTQRPRWFEAVGIALVVLGLVIQGRVDAPVPGPSATLAPDGG